MDDRFGRSVGTGLIALEECCVAGRGVLREYLLPNIGEPMPLPFPGRLAEFYFWFVHSCFASEASGVGQHGQLCADVLHHRRIDVYNSEFRLLAQAEYR